MQPRDDDVELRAGDARLVVDPRAGGRLASLTIGDLELLVTESGDPLGWGCYAMAPWPGRMPGGRFEFDDRAHRIPTNFGAHAIHGLTWQREWRRVGAASWSEATLEIELGDDWPFGGRAVQHFALEPDRLRLRIELHADRAPFPAAVGWHPWFRRRLARGGPARLRFEARESYEMSEDLVPTGTLRGIPPRPWDDCFVGLSAAPRIEWPGALTLELRSAVDHWVVYERSERGICVEAMTGPPNALNLEPAVVTPDAPLSALFEWRWSD